jgi:adenine-specific DNA-methyltransferase
MHEKALRAACIYGNIQLDKHAESDITMNISRVVYDNTITHLETISRAERKKIGQFFTPVSIAEYMGSLSNVRKDTLHVLDPGAGSGILSAAVVEVLLKTTGLKQIDLDVYENNIDIIPLLKSNLSYMQETAKQKNIALNYNIIEENFITANHFAWTGLIPNEKYDIVISNPPYKKIGKSDQESRIMKEIVYGQPNLYFLFMAMGACLLKENGEFIFITPRSFSSGLYFTVFRNRFLSTMRITHLHLFASRESISGENDNVLQETVILRAVKSKKHFHSIKITESTGEDCLDTLNPNFVDYDICVRQDDNSFLFFPTCEEDIKALDFVNQWPTTLIKLGYKMKTGIVVDFRETEWLRSEDDDNSIPLLWAYNFHNHRVKFPVEVKGKPQYLVNVPETKRLQMEKGNYVLLKRFTSKEEHKRLQCALLFDSDFSKYENFSTENHLNYITRINGEMSKDEIYGLFTILNSSYFDRYFRVLNGSTQVNANEINAIPFPAFNDIVQIGRRAISFTDLTRLDCDTILEAHFTSLSVRKAI